ncbi:L-lysine 6-transaminase [Elizabethkingia argentiflava]|uniref:L-lysine-epsilon aminotransferase n=1 Tax=Elizabethkingia argenteiflava TaxID=2681556 RepID=A0A845Q0B6_9FLAO|nr:L-lysine 6-transaminase [Elizabethkingia argenteiflava]NAW52127.1 L-lysine 6-transaminase [Elizabethkingia argenteiflava]
MITKENSVKKTLQKHMLADGLDIVMDFENSKASRIVDKLTGKTYLDMFSMFASGAVGYNHPYILQHQAWLAKYATYKPTLSDIYFEEYADFLEVFSRVVIPQELQYCFFIEGGALAVENALKTAFDWKTRKNRQQGSRIQASMVIHFEQAFHGRSGYTLSLTNTSDPRKYEYFPKFNWPRIINPKLKFPISEESLATTLEQEAKALMHIQEVILANPYQVACIIIEPIQSEGGDNYFRPEFFQNLRKICDENDILLIFDEVQTGIGITGKMFAFQHINVIPDILSFGKKTQVCGILANKEKLDQVEQHVFKESSRINSTFGGNFVDMLRLKLILEIIENENLVQNAQKQGEFLLSGLIKLQESFPDYISNARGLGLVCAIDLPSTELRNEIQNQLFIEKQILILPCGEKSLRFRPHLNIQEPDLEEVLSAISAVVTKDHL